MLTSKKLPIILIGPRFVGKSTVGKLLALQLKVPFINLWEVSEQYWHEIGYKEELRDQAWDNNQADGVYNYMMPFEAHAIACGVAEHSNYVIELGALQSVYDDDELFKRVSRVLEACNVVLLLPSEDVSESLEILKKRDRVIINSKEINEHFLTHHSNYDLAKYTFHTKNKTPEQTSEEILANIDPNASEIILIGAMGAGKSTIGQLLAQKLDLPQISMDRLRWKYYEEIGWSKEKQKQIAENEGFAGVYHYWKQYDLHAVERLLNEYQDCVIDFGAGHSIYERDEDFERVRELLAPYANIVLLIPSPDLDESVAILRQRNTLLINGMEANRFLIIHPSNQDLAKHIVYTKERMPIETKDEIIKRLEFTNPNLG
ncbi:shikimate kinase [Pleurocapsa sp. PCC 7319]|uniref:shikimate kinase n=1 Tax=Pleurocapsa sp. PCC 7319 TaxID=118161 RepID=UPI00034626F3|nr:shikimate kinase [Pleurocapsa sp. PCC 7319]